MDHAIALWREGRTPIKSARMAGVDPSSLYRALNHTGATNMTTLIKIKSVMPVLAGNEWRIRGRFVTDGPCPVREVFYGVGAKYSLAQAQVYAQNKMRDIAHHGIDAI
jgi:hypothetical protein